MALTVREIQALKPKEKRYRVNDEKGLYLEISPSGGKWWRLRYWIDGKENRLSLGVYPEISLKDARDRRDEARRQIAQGIDPSQARKGAKKEAEADALTFEKMFLEWLGKFSASWTEHHAKDTLHRMQQNILPWMGAVPIQDITAPDILAAVQRVESRGAPEQARRLLQKISAVFRYAEALGHIRSNPAASLRGAIPPTPKRHLPSVKSPKEVARLMHDIEGYEGSHVTRCALKLAAYAFVRPGELRHAEWSEIDIAAKEWRIPGEKMKMREQHLIPLSRQALAVLQELRPLTGEGKYLFPGVRSAARPMSENTVNAALRRMGYEKSQMTGHGFRSMASTLLNEQGWNRDAIDRQLAHAERDEIRASYNFAEYLPERRRMMQAWADYLDSLKDGGKVLPMYKTSNE